MDLWSSMYADGFFSAPDVTSNDLPGLVKQGKFGMMLYGTWFANTLLAAGLSDADIGFFRVPPRGSAAPAVVVESGSLSVPVKAHRHGAAVDVAANWLATDVQTAWVGFLGDTSPNPHALPKSNLVKDAGEGHRRHPTRSSSPATGRPRPPRSSRATCRTSARSW